MAATGEQMVAGCGGSPRLRAKRPKRRRFLLKISLKSNKKHCSPNFLASASLAITTQKITLGGFSPYSDRLLKMSSHRSLNSFSQDGY
jgi:hypothetical protein